MSLEYGMPQPFHGTLVCPFCGAALFFERRIREALFWSHQQIMDFQLEYAIDVCRNNAAMFWMREVGAPLERLEPII